MKKPTLCEMMEFVAKQQKKLQTEEEKERSKVGLLGILRYVNSSSMIIGSKKESGKKKVVSKLNLPLLGPTYTPSAKPGPLFKAQMKKKPIFS